MIFNVGAGGASTADKVKYDNTESGLQSNNVQGAVDELNSSLNSLDLKVSGIEKILVFKGNLSSSTGYTEVTTLDENIREKTTVVSIMCGSVGDLETNSGVIIKINTQTGLVRINNPVTQFVGYPYVLILAVTK